MKVLVLDIENKPINITTLQKGFKLVLKGKAEILEYVEDMPIVTAYKTFKRPTVIKLLRYVYIPFKKVQLSRQNVFRRDNHTCMYCGSRKHLTIDHVMPKSRGGRNTWKNFATSCSDCNVKKGNKTPEEAGMVLSHEPFVPSYLMFVKKMSRIHGHWQEYVKLK